nr:MAG TPA: hypothetical protein [Caudoviricetes sp.]
MFQCYHLTFCLLIVKQLYVDKKHLSRTFC